MTLQNHVNDLVRDTVEVSLPLFKPELVLCVTIVAMLLLKIPRATSWISSALLALLGSIVALWCALPLESLGLGEAGVTLLPPQEIFTGMLVYDSLTVYLRCLLLLFAVLFIVLTSITGMGRGEDGPDMYTLVLGATLGMCIMASANHLITIFLGVEMASVPSYVLAGIAKGRPRASEAALKYAVYGAGAAGVMLYGISLLAGVIGSAHLPTMAERLAAMDVPAMISAGDETGTLMVLALGGLMTMAGLAFKLSAVPYHFWCPDVFEGATAEVNAFLSVASKAAALALLVRVAFGFGISPTEVELAVRDGVGDSPLQFAALDPADPPSVQPIAAEVAAADGDAPVDEIVVAESEVAEPEVETAVAPLSPVRSFIVGLIAVIAMVTSTFGNLAAYGQTNIKRLLAYSTIAHAGYMMLPVAAAVALTGRPDDAGDAIGAMLFYASVYLFMNLGAFAIVAFLRDAMHSEEIADYAGLIRSAPFITIAFVVILFSLVGLPPLAGFVGKVFIFLALIKAGGPLLLTALVVAGINTVISLVYYLRVAKVMCIDPEPDTRPPVSMKFIPAFYALLVATPVVLLGIFFDELLVIARSAGVQMLGSVRARQARVDQSQPNREPMIALLQPDTVEILNRLMAIHCTSFPQYMAYARPYVPLGKEAILESLKQIGDDQTRMADRISDMVRGANAVLETGDFPMEFTDTHDLGISRILAMAIAYQHEDIRSIAQYAEQLRLAPAAHALAEEAVGMAKGHLEMLQELDPV